MPRGIFVIGTDTDIGKTLICAGLCFALKNYGIKTAYLKPVASGSIIDENGEENCGDISFTKEVSGIENISAVNPYFFKNPSSPHLASRIENIDIDPEIIFSSFKETAEKHEILVVEGCGGIAVPMNSSFYMQHHLIKKMNLNCILVCHSGLGSINHTILTAAFAKQEGIRISGIIANRYLPSLIHDDNISVIEKITGIPVLFKVPVLDNLKITSGNYSELRKTFSTIEISKITDVMSEL